MENTEDKRPISSDKYSTALYNTLKLNNAYDKDYDTFYNDFYAPGIKGYTYRKEVYDFMKKGGVDYIGDTYEDFASKIGLHAIDPQTQQTPMGADSISKDMKPVEVTPTKKPEAKKEEKPEVSAEAVSENQRPIDTLQDFNPNVSRMRNAGTDYYLQAAEEISNNAYSKSLEELANQAAKDLKKKAYQKPKEDSYVRLNQTARYIPIRSLPKDADLDSVFEAALTFENQVCGGAKEYTFASLGGDIQERYEKWKALRGLGSIYTQETASMSPNAVYLQARNLQALGKERPAWISELRWNEALNYDKNKLNKITAELEQEDQKRRLKRSDGAYPDDVSLNGMYHANYTALMASDIYNNGTNKTIFVLFQDGRIRPLQAPDPSILRGGVEAQRELFRRQYEKMTFGEEGKDYTDPYEKNRVVGNFLQNGEVCHIIYFPYMIEQRRWDDAQELIKIGLGGKFNEEGVLLNPDDRLQIVPVVVKNGESEEDAIAKAKVELDNEISKKLPYKETYLQQQIAQAREALKKEQERLKQFGDHDAVKGSYIPEMFNPSFYKDLLESSTEEGVKRSDEVALARGNIRKLEESIKKYTQALEALRTGDKVGAWGGFLEGISDLDNWTFGLYNLRENLVAVKAHEGKMGQEAKDRLGLARSLSQESMSAFHRHGEGRLYGPAFGAGYSFPFTIGAIATYGAGNVAARGIIRGGSRMAAKYGTNWLFDTTIRATTRLAAINAAGVIDSSFQMPRIISDAAIEKMGLMNYTFDENQRIVVTGTQQEKSWGHSLLHSGLNTLVQNVSERVGTYVLEPVAKAFGIGKISLRSFGEALPYNKTIHMIQNGAFAKAMSKVYGTFEKGGYDGFVNEVLEEYIANPMTATFDENYTFADIFDSRQNLDTALSVWASSIFMLGFSSTASSVKYYRTLRSVNSAYDKAEANARRLFGNENWDKIQNTILRLEGEPLVNAIYAGVCQNKSLSDEQKKAFLNYVRAQKAQAVFNNAVSEKYSFSLTGEELNEMNAMTIHAYAEGRNMQTPQEYAQAQQAFADTREMAMSALGVTDDIDAYLDTLGETPAEQLKKGVEVAKENGLDEKAANAALSAYLNAREQQKGAMDGITSDESIRRQHADSVIRQITFENEADSEGGSGKVILVNVKGREKPVFLIRGRYENGSITGETVVVSEGNGVIEMIPASEVEGIVEESDAMTERQRKYDKIDAENKEQQRLINLNMDTPLAGQGGILMDEEGHRRQVGIKCVFNDEQGNPASVLVVDQNNNDYLIPIDVFREQRGRGRKFEAIEPYLDETDEEYHAAEGPMNEEYNLANKEQEGVSEEDAQGAAEGVTPQSATDATEKPTKPEVKYDYHVKMKDGSGNAVSGRVTNLSADGVEIEFDAPYNGKMVDRIPLADFDSGVSEIADANGNVLWNETEAVGDTEVAPQVDATPTQAGQEDAGKPAIAQAEQEHKPTALERIPKDENGNPIYEQTDAETAFTGLTEEAGNVIEAEEIAKSMVEDKEKALEKAKKIKLPSGVSVAEKVKAAKVRTQAIAKAQEELDKWKAIAEVPAQQRAKVVEERIAKEKAEAEAKRKAEEEAKRASEEAESELNSTIENVLNTIYKKGKDYASKIFNRNFFDFAKAPDFMKHLGMTGSKFTIRYGVIARHFGKDGSHDFTKSEWEQIPHAIEHPFAITQLKNKEKGFRIYTALKTEKGDYVVVGADVKNAGRDIEVNAITTLFGRRSNANLSENEEIIYKSKEITPEQEALLGRPNSDQYPAERELSTDKVTESSPSTQENRPKNSTQSAVKSASAEVETSPTEAQKKAGNYKMGHVKVGAFDVTIENPKGSERSGTDANGKKWSVKMNNTYGYIRGTEGVDGDHIDVFLAEDMDKWDGKYVFVVDQYNPDGTFDEHKVMLGFNSMEEARNAYLSNYEKGWENGRRIDVTAVNLEDFEKWIESSKRKTKPFAEYAGVKKETIGNAPAKEEATPTKAETKQTKTSESKGYTITPSTYTNKKGKTSDVSLLTFDHNLTADQERAVKEFAKERIGEGRFAPARGWKDRESGGWMFRSEEDARKAAEMVGNEEAVADNQPMTAQELRDAVEPKKPTASKKTAAKKPANRVEVADVAEQKPSEPTKAEQPKLNGEKKLVITDEMKHDEDILRELLGIGDEELDGGIKFRDPDAMTSQQRRFVYNAGVNYSLGYIDQGFVKFPEFAKAMVSRLGYKIKPWLKSFYEGAKRIPGYDQAMFTPTEEVDAFDVENFDKPHKDVFAQANMIVEEGKAQVAAEKANNELKATRNEQRKETEKQTAANTDAIGSKATSVASEVENLAETSSDRQELGGASERVDETLDKVNEQLALLGYYEAEQVEKDYNEAYGYMRNAEKKAVKDAANLASQLIDDLGLDRFEATHGEADKKGKRKTKPLAVANIAPLGGDVSMHLPLEEGRELYVNIQLVPSAGRGVAKFEGDNLKVTRIMFRVDNPNGNGRYDRRYGINVWVNKDVTYSELLDKVKREVYKYLPERTEVSDGKFAAGDKVQYSTDGGRTWTDAVVAHPNDEGGYLIDTGLAPVLWVNAHPDQLRHKPESNTISDTELIKRITEHPLFKELVDNNPDAQAARTLLGERIMTDVRLSLRKDGYVETYKKLLNDKGFSEKIADKAFAKRHIVSKNDEGGYFYEDGINEDAVAALPEGIHINDDVTRRSENGGVQHTASEKPVGKPKSAAQKTTKKVKPEQPVGDLFAGPLDKPNNNGTADSNSSSPSQTVAGGERPNTVGIDETGTDGGKRTTAVTGTDGERSTDASRENGREAADGAVHGTDEVGGIQPPVGNRGRDESAANRTVSNGATDERGRVAGPRTVQTGETDGGGKELSSGEPASSTGEGSRPSAVKKQRTPVRKFTNNFHYGTDGNEADNYTPAQRLEGNVSAIEVIAKLFKEGRKATDEEKQILSRFRGWGQIDQLSKFYSVDQMRRNTYGNSPYHRLADAIDTLDPDGKKGVFAGIKRAALSSYYTPTKIASAMNSFLSLAGFKGGTFLDPSMGNGIFEGTLPKDIQGRTMITGVELDWLSGQISRALYPDADVRICGFEKSGLTPNSQDVVTSNVPFGDIEVNDPTWKNDNSPIKRSAQKRIHNYYAVKMLELTRPGGIVAMMTSPAVMDTQSNQHIRRYIAEQGEFLGAVRLPDNTFQGTGAMADIIYIRKWKDEEDAQKTRENPDYVAREQAFLSSAETTAPNKRNGEKQKVSHNAYYASNRKNMIGDVVAGNQYNDKSFGLHSELTTDQIAKEVEKAVKRIVGDRKGMLFDTTRTSREVKQAVREEYKGDGNWVSTGNLVIQDGKVGVLTATKNEYGEVTRVFEEQPQLAKQKMRIIAMGEVRTAMKELIAGQIDGLSDTKLNMLRAKLKRAYGEFVSKYGKLQDTDNAVILSDIDGYTLQALEVWKGGKFQGLSDIFTKNTIKPALKLEDAKTPQEAITTSLAEYGEIRGEYIEKTLGADWFEQCGDLVFKEPNATDRYVTRDEYLSGDVVAKLEEAKTAAATDPTFERNVKELEQVQPATIPFDDITIHLGARWIPQEVLNDFVKETLGLHASSSRNYEWVDGERREIIKSGVVYVPETDSFEINIEEKELGGQADDWKTADKSIKEIFQVALEDKDFRIVRKDKDGNTWIDQEATELANSKVADLREHFEQWLPGNDARIQIMERAYNDRFNRIVLRKWDGSHLNVPGLMGKELRPHQKDAVWMLINNRGGIVDHIVGAGKTLVMQSAIMEMRRMGIAKKPMIVALKSTVPQIAREFKEAYPTARVLAPSEKDFSTENRKKFFANISLNDYDCIIVSHEQYCKIPHSEEAEGDVVNEQLAQLDAMIEYLYGTGDKSQLTKRQIKSLEKRRQNLHAKLEKRLDRSTDREFCFENMGIDYLFVDECHQFKSLPYVTSYQNVAGLGEASGSNKAVALLTGIRHLQKMHQGDKGTVFLSGTTITNSLVEIYNLLNYLRPRKLEQLGMPTFDAWASTFAVHSSELEAGVSNEFKMKDRFRYFDNVPELSQLYAEIADVRNDYNLQLPKPKVDGKTVIVPQSDAVAEINREVVKMLRTKDGSYFGIHPINPKKFPWGLVASGISAKAAVSPRLVFPDMDDSVGKISYCCDNIKKSYDEMKEQKGVQLVFCELGVPTKGNKYDAYHDIINRLTKDYGIPRDEIAYIQQVKNDTEKEALFQKVRDGKVRILIGGTRNMGTGVNVQTRITDLHMLTVPWQPADLEQCIGRGSRQGNVVAHDFLNNKVRVHYYATEGSLDLYKYQLLDAKGKMFTQFKMGTISGERSFDEGDADENGNIDPAQMVALLSGNPIIFEKSKQDKLVKKLKSLYNGFLRDQQRKRQNYETVTKKVENLKRLISLSDSDVHDLQREGFKPDDKGTYPSKVKVTVEDSYYGQNFDKPKEAGQYILEQLKNNKKVVLAGFGQRADIVFVTDDDLLSSHYEVQIGGNNAWSIRYTKRMPQDPTQAGLVFRSLLEQIIHNNEVYHREYDTNSEMLKTMPKGDAPFSKQKELDEAIAKQKELDAEYNKLGQSEEDKTKFRLLDADDPKAMELEALPDSELVPVYRNVQAFEDDTLGSPMAFSDAETGERRTLEGGKWNYSNPPQIKLTDEQQRKLDELNKNGYIMVDGKKSTELQINDGLKFVKPKTKEAQLQYFLKKNPKDKGLWAAYDPYDHAIETPLNTQFGEANKRPNLVVVRSLIPKSEIDEPFHADYALLPTGAHQWNNGRTLYLSRWSKIDKVLTREEEAKMIDEYWKKHPGKREALKSHRDYNRFVPQVRRELEKMGYRFELDGKELTPVESLALDKQNWEGRDVIPGREGQLPFISNEDIARINAKTAGKWVGEPKEVMESAMSERVTELSERLHTPVRIIRTEAEVAALPSVRQRRMKGSFNPITGEVTIVVSNNANMADIENTFVHEVVGHDGLRVLFPDEAKLNNALDELYRVSKDEIRGTIDRMAQKMYDAEVDRLRERKRKEHEAKGEDTNTLYHTDIEKARSEASKKSEQFRRDATEEYAADLAGRIGESGFETMSAEELTFWGKLTTILQKALQKLLDGLKIPGKRKWSDKDWAFILHEAYKRKKNGGKPTVFDAADTVVMRRKTGFGDTKFSDGKVEENHQVATTIADMKKRVTELFQKAKTGEFVGKPASIGRLSADGKAYLEKLSDLKFKEFVDFVLNPSDLNHIRSDHYGENEKDKGNNVPLTDEDIQNMVDVLNQPDGILYGVDKKDGRKLFFFLKDAGNGLYNLTEVCSTKKGNLTAKSFFKSKKKGISQRVMEIKDSLLPTSVTYSGEFLSSDAKIPTLFDINESSSKNVADGGIMFRNDDIGLEETITKIKVEAAQAAQKATENLNLGGRVVVHESAEGLEGREATAKGWYDTRTGQIHVVLSNNTDAADVTQTILHEAVAHHGLRELFGHNVMDAFLDSVLAAASQEVKDAINELRRGKGWNFRTATEEYLAGLAERTDFERMTAEERGLFATLRRLFNRALEFLGLKNRELSDRELAYILWCSYQNLKTGEKGRYVAEAERIAMRYKLKAGKNAMTDTEKKEHSVLLRGELDNLQEILAKDTYERLVTRGSHLERTAWVDMLSPLQDLQHAIEKNGGFKLGDFENPYNAYITMSSRNYAQMDIYKRTLYADMIEAIHALGSETGRSYEEIKTYVMAKHGMERQKYMAGKAAEEAYDRYKSMHPFGQKTLDYFIDEYEEKSFAGLTELFGTQSVSEAMDEAQKYVEEVEAEAGSLTDSMWDSIRAATKSSLQRAYEAGLISKETYDNVSSMYQYYIPLRGFDEATSDEVYEYFGDQTINGGTGSFMKKAKGRKSVADDPFAVIGNMAEMAIMQSNRNLMKQQLLNLALNHPSDLISVSDLYVKFDEDYDNGDGTRGAWVPVAVPDTSGMTTEEANQVMLDFQDDMEEKVKDEPDTYALAHQKPHIPYRVLGRNMNEHQVMVKRGGKTYILTINGNPRAAQAINGLLNPDATENPGAIALKAMTNWIARMATARNVEFAISNAMRDLEFSTTLIPKEGTEYYGRYVKNYLTCVKNIGRLVNRLNGNTLDMSNPLEKAFYDFIYNGGETGYTFMKGVERYKGEITKALSELRAKEGKSKIERLSNKVVYGHHYVINDAWNIYMKGAEYLSRCTEDWVRFAVFLTSRQMGRSMEQSIMDAKEVTINFNRKGAGSKSAGKWDVSNFFSMNNLHFLSAYAASVFKNFYAFSNASIQGLDKNVRLHLNHTAGMLMWDGAAVTLGMLSAMCIPLMLSAIGGDPDDYWDMPESMRRMGIMLPLGKDGRFLTLPMSIEHRAAYGIGELLGTVVCGSENLPASEITFQAFEQLSQILPLDLTEGNGSMLSLVPTAVRPEVEIAFNKNWLGMPIYKEPFNKNTPAFRNVYQSTNPNYIAMSKWLNEVQGGGDYERAGVQVNPAMVQHLVESYTGGAGKFVSRTSGVIAKIIQGEQIRSNEIPFYRTLVKSVDDRTHNRAARERFQREYDKGQKLIYKIDNYQKESARGNSQYVKELDEFAKSKDFMSYMLWKSYNSVKSQFDNARSYIGDDKDKRAALDHAQMLVQKIMTECARAVEDSKTQEEADEKIGRIQSEYTPQIKETLSKVEE
jgi:N12 class adenine-specific DNA methylase